MTTSIVGSGSNEAVLSLLRLPDVLQRTGFSRSCVYKLIKKGSFPPPIKVGRMSGWIAGEINIWINQQIQISRGRSVC